MSTHRTQPRSSFPRWTAPTQPVPRFRATDEVAPRPAARHRRPVPPVLPAGLALGALGAALLGGGVTTTAATAPTTSTDETAGTTTLPPATLPAARTGWVEVADLSSAISDVWPRGTSAPRQV